MIVGGIGSNAVTVVPDTATAAATAPQAPVLAGSGGGAVPPAATQPNATTGAGVARTGPGAMQPTAQAGARVADAYTPPSNPSVALPELGTVGAPKSGAYQDLL